MMGNLQIIERVSVYPDRSFRLGWLWYLCAGGNLIEIVDNK
jgi:hypothetical protein